MTDPSSDPSATPSSEPSPEPESEAEPAPAPPPVEAAATWDPHAPPHPAPPLANVARAAVLVTLGIAALGAGVGGCGPRSPPGSR